MRVVVANLIDRAIAWRTGRRYRQYLADFQEMESWSRERFEACREAMARLSAARDAAWLTVRRLRELVTMATIDARRRTGGLMVKWLAALRDALAEAEALGLPIVDNVRLDDAVLSVTRLVISKLKKFMPLAVDEGAS